MLGSERVAPLFVGLLGDTFKARSQPPEYHFQLTPAALKVSPMFRWYGRVRSAGLLSFWEGSSVVALGLPLAVGAGRLISSQLYNVPFWDPLALALAAGALAVCALIAAIIPASVAASISPMTALRSE